MAHIIPFEPTVKKGTLASLLQQLLLLARRKHLTISWPYAVPRENEMLNGVEILSTIAGPKTHYHLPLFGERVARYPGLTLFVGRSEGRPALVLRPHPMGENGEEDFFYLLSVAERSLNGRDAIMMRMGLEQILEEAIVASHDLLEGRRPRPRREPTFPVLRGIEAHLDLIDGLNLSRKFIKADLELKKKNEKWQKNRGK